MRSVPLQRKIKGCGRDIIKLPDFKSLKKRLSFAIRAHIASL